MARAKLNLAEYRDRVLGCWTGKSVGGTLGGPFEGRRELLDVSGFATPPGEPLPNDDLDLQLVWLKALEERGPKGLSAAVLGEYWLNYVPPPWNEYGLSKANQRAGLPPPLSGSCHNRWKHSNGAWIRSEIWACLAPGCPDLAARLAWEDAAVDHGDGEGTFAAMFTAALQSAAFVEFESDRLLDAALSKIPGDCRVARAVGLARQCHRQGLSWREARERLVEDSADLGWFMAPANVGFVIVGWLYGDGDFGRSLCTAVSCGDDTDCTGATLGALLGILLGRSGLPEEWAGHAGDRIATIAIDRGSAWDWPQTLDELTDRVAAMAPAVLAAHRAPVSLTEGPTDRSGLPALVGGEAVQDLWRRSGYALRADLVHTLVELDLLQEPRVRPGHPFPVAVRLANRMPDSRLTTLRWLLPEGWTATPCRALEAMLEQDASLEVRFELLPGPLPESRARAILEVSAVGRPTVGLVPVTFLTG
ncbi:MAG: ADP-ribosylglycohydrolase family protein [Fimbriimonadales bacterium]|nr:ADP-ribosylglycohydrolase family protein [Fimbriimonadales bacterium]